jgi:hypothetical protein
MNKSVDDGHYHGDQVAVARKHLKGTKPTRPGGRIEADQSMALRDYGGFGGHYDGEVIIRP